MIRKYVPTLPRWNKVCDEEYDKNINIKIVLRESFCSGKNCFRSLSVSNIIRTIFLFT